jgi:peptidoglycan/xylan/chitin deacetylase (PgdA/CDA1 family)
MLLIAAAIAIILILLAENADLKSQLDAKPTNTTPLITTAATGGYSSPPQTIVTPAVTTAVTVPPPSSAYSHLFPELYAQSNGNSSIEYREDDGNTIYLTFDDGPHNSRTVQVLDHLKRLGVKATFFVIPKDSAFSERTLKRIHNEGHSIGVHSFSHNYTEIYAGVEEFLEDFGKARNLIYEQTGVLSDFYRFPGGSINDWNKETRDSIIAEMNRRGFVYFDWNIDSGDALGASYGDMYREVPQKVAQNRTNGRRSIILFHDAGPNTTRVIDDLIMLFQRDPAGYKFETIDMNVRPNQW